MFYLFSTSILNNQNGVKIKDKFKLNNRRFLGAKLLKLGYSSTTNMLHLILAIIRNCNCIKRKFSVNAYTNTFSHVQILSFCSARQCPIKVVHKIGIVLFYLFSTSILNNQNGVKIKDKFKLNNCRFLEAKLLKSGYSSTTNMLHLILAIIRNCNCNKRKFSVNA